MIRMIRLDCASGRLNNLAWMVDKDGVAVPINTHVQKQDDGGLILDEYGLACAMQYAEMTNDSEYYAAVRTIILCQFFEYLDAWLTYGQHDESDKVNFDEVLSGIEDPNNRKMQIKALQLPDLTMSAGDILDMIYDQEPFRNMEKAMSTLHTLFDRRMMRVRVGGIIESTGSADIYFRIPDSIANGWYTGIGNFLYDHPQYADFQLHIYEETNNANNRRELESYSTVSEFLDIKSSRSVPKFKKDRLNSAFKIRR